MLIVKLLSNLISPSTIIILLFIACWILLFKKQEKRAALTLLAISTGTLYLFSISPIADLLIFPLEHKYSTVQNLTQADIMVMLTGGEEGNILRAKEVLRLYYKRPDKMVKIIISGNDFLSYKTESSAAGVKRMLLESGVSPESIIIDEISRTTFESAQNVKKLTGRTPFYLVTSGYHMPRSLSAFRAFNTNPLPAPTDFKISYYYNFFSLFPNPKNLEKINLAFHEYLGIIFYKLKYPDTNMNPVSW